VEAISVPKNLIKPFTETQSKEIAEILKAIGHPVRLRIVDALSMEAICVGELAEMLEQKQAVVSQQLKTLRLVGLVKSQRHSGKSYYSLNNPHLLELLNCMRRCAYADI
jgi:DNA-binding transcriptional ArsR family regulator